MHLSPARHDKTRSLPALLWFMTKPPDFILESWQARGGRKLVLERASGGCSCNTTHATGPGCQAPLPVGGEKTKSGILGSQAFVQKSSSPSPALLLPLSSPLTRQTTTPSPNESSQPCPSQNHEWDAGMIHTNEHRDSLASQAKQQDSAESDQTNQAQIRQTISAPAKKS